MTQAAEQSPTVATGRGWTMYLGDCLGFVAPVDHVVSDPPYGFGAYRTDRDDGAVVERLRAWRPPGSMAVFGYPETLVGWCIDLGWRPDEWIVWWPTNAAAKAGGRHKGVPRQTEHIAIFGPTPGAGLLVTPRSATGVRLRQARGAEESLDVRLGDVWQDASPGIALNAAKRLHPNEKPVALMIKAVSLVSEPGALVADPFAGSGTTGVAALRLGRRFVGCELNPENFRIACERLRAEEAGSTLEASRAGQASLFGVERP